MQEEKIKKKFYNLLDVFKLRIKKGLYDLLVGRGIVYQHLLQSLFAKNI